MSISRIVHLFSSDVSVLLAQSDGLIPAIVHWGSRIEADDATLRAFVEAEERAGIDGISDLPYRAGLLPEHSEGWAGRPGLELHRGGTAWAPRLSVRSVTWNGEPLPTGVTQRPPGRLSMSALDEWAEIHTTIEIDLSEAGLLGTRAELRNGSESLEPLHVQSAALFLPIPTEASEILDFSGRWAHERIPQRHPVVRGSHARTSRRGRTGLDATMALVAGIPGFSSDSGEVWMGHVSFSGNHEHAIDREDGSLAFRGSEVLLPGEVRLAPGESYSTPWIYGSYGQGLDAASARFHHHLRAVSRSSRRDRPVTLNVWEAVYFDHDPETIGELARSAAELGVERFVLDDGWFLNRRDDRAGLGDWIPDPAAWPQGLRPLADEVRALGMEFGLWVEPEMINEDSELARAHPDWILRARPELPPAFRFQQLLDLTNPHAYAHILGRLDALVSEIGVTYLKWDHNRDLIAAGHPESGAAAVHEQTLALYRLLDELRARHPALEIESCASGGGRVDLGILSRTDRIHPSDNHDPVDRFHILRWTGLLVPPEMLGSHVASAVSSATGRTHDLHVRCAVALIGHFGIEWDIRDLGEPERETLRHWIALYRRFRGLIQNGRSVGGGELHSACPAVRGVVAQDSSEGLFTIITPSTTSDTLARVRFAGLSDERRYRVTASSPESLGPPWQVPQWLRASPGIGVEGEAPVLAGSMLRRIGLQFPTFHPDKAVVVHVQAVNR